MCVKDMVYEKGKMKVTFRLGEKEMEIDIMLIRKEHRWFLRNVRAV